MSKRGLTQAEQTVSRTVAFQCLKDELARGKPSVLTERQFEVMYLRYYEGKTLRQIADQLDLSREGVRQVLLRGHARIERYICWRQQ